MLIPLLWLLACLTASSGWSANAPTAQPKGKASAAANLPDAALEKEIRARFARSKISADNFRVRVQGGVAYLEGQTNVIQRKGTATRLAKLAGAKAVVNHIQISEQARAQAAANLAKGRRRAQVVRGEARSQR